MHGLGMCYCSHNNITENIIYGFIHNNGDFLCYIHNIDEKCFKVSDKTIRSKFIRVFSLSHEIHLLTSFPML
jgi:hypothetical protein